MLLMIHLEPLFYFEKSDNIQVVKSQNAEAIKWVNTWQSPTNLVAFLPAPNSQQTHLRDEQVNTEENLTAYTLTLTQPWAEGFPK